MDKKLILQNLKPSDKQKNKSLDDEINFENSHLQEQGIDIGQLRAARLYKNKGDVSIQNNQFSEAEQFYAQAIELHPLKPLYFCKRALALCYLNLNTEAIQDCTKALIIDPEFSKAYGVLGMAHYNLKNWHEAVKAFSKAVHLDRENTDFQSRLKWAREHLFESLMAKSPTSGHQRTDMFNFRNMEQYIAEAGRIMAMADSGRRKLSPILPRWLQEHEPRYGDKFRTHKSHNSTTSEADPNRRERGDGGSRGTQ